MHHIKVIKDGNVNNVVKEQLVDGVPYVDDEPREGSLNGITSDAVAKVAGDVGDVKDVIPEGTTEENPLVNESTLDEARPKSPDDGFYVSRNGVWKKVYDLTVIPIEGFPVDGEDYEKIGDFNGNLYPYAKIEATGTVDVGMFNYDTKSYDSETEVIDETKYIQLDAGGQYEIHAKGSGTVSVTVSADAFDEEGGEDEEA